MRIHPQDFVLREFLQEPEAVAANVPAHLERCDQCKRRLEALSQETPEPPRIPTSYEAALDRGFRLLEARQAALNKERAEAPLLLARLREHPPERQELLLRNHPRFQTWGLLECLLKEAKEKAFNAPAGADEMGRLALKLASHLDASCYGENRIQDLWARAWVFRGNARRVRWDLQGADQAFEQALFHLQQGTGDPIERAVLLDFKASLRRAQGFFGEALRLEQRAIEIFQELGDTHRAGEAMVNMSTVHEYTGKPEKAIEVLQRSLHLIDAALEPRLLLFASHNLTFSFTSIGRFTEAWHLFAKTRPLYEDFPISSSQNRRKWVEGRIARGLQQWRKAEVLFLEARSGFSSADAPYDADLVSRELASLRAAQRRR